MEVLAHGHCAISVTQIVETTCSLTIYPVCFPQLPTQRSSRQNLEQKLCLHTQVKKKKVKMLNVLLKYDIVYIFKPEEKKWLIILPKLRQVDSAHPRWQH